MKKPHCTLEQRRKWIENNREKVREYDRRWQEENKEKKREYGREYAKKYKKRINAMAVVHRSVKSGRLKKPIHCSRCGDAGYIHAHHPDYDKPREVVWFCTSCHKKEHLGISLVEEGK